jgi:hypothetical protein
MPGGMLCILLCKCFAADLVFKPDAGMRPARFQLRLEDALRMMFKGVLSSVNSLSLETINYIAYFLHHSII